MMATFAELLERAQRHDEFWEEDIAADFTEELVRWMEEKGISRSELAARIGHRPSYVTKVLRGTVNLTAASMAKLARAVGARVRIHLSPPEARTVWYDIHDSGAYVNQVEQVESKSLRYDVKHSRALGRVAATTATVTLR